MTTDDDRFRVRCADCGEVYAEGSDGVTWGAAPEVPQAPGAHAHRPGVIEIPVEDAAILAGLLDR